MSASVVHHTRLQNVLIVPHNATFCTGTVQLTDTQYVASRNLIQSLQFTPHEHVYVIELHSTDMFQVSGRTILRIQYRRFL